MRQALGSRYLRKLCARLPRAPNTPHTEAEDAMNLNVLPLAASLLVVLGYFALSFRPLLLPARAPRKPRH